MPDKLPMDGENRLRVHLVPMPSGDNPWRTRQDYIDDKKRDSIRFWVIITGCVIACITASVSWMQMIEARKERIQAEQALAEANLAKERVEKVATTLLKITYVLADGSGRFGGFPEPHMNKIRAYQKSILSFTHDSFMDEVKQDIEEINEQIQKGAGNGQE